MTRRAAAIANDPLTQQAAWELLAAQSSAVGAVLAGFFAAAGAYPDVLLGPVTLLVGGTGNAARAFDGRLRQPGIGGKRPRGFTSAELIPDAARIGVPMSVAALLAAHAYETRSGLGNILRAGVQQARRGGALQRARLLERIRSAGAGALTEASFARALLRVAGASEGGLLTLSDFHAVPELDFAAAERTLMGSPLLLPPWAHEPTLQGQQTLGDGYAVCAMDSRGAVAALCFRRTGKGLAVDELELEVPLAAIPVRRGIRRLGPGSALPAPAPIALFRSRDEGTITEALAAPAAPSLEDPTAQLRLNLRRDPRTRAVYQVDPSKSPLP